MSRFVVFALVAALGCGFAPTPAPRVEALRPVLIQGAMELEVARLVDQLEDSAVEQVGAWTFWRGTIDGYPVIVSRTRMGAAHAAAATALAIERYQPIAILNQGTAGGHDPSLRVYDIVLGTAAVSLAAFKTPYRPAGNGSDPLAWTPLDLMESAEDSTYDIHEGEISRFPGDSSLLAAARSVSQRYTMGRVVEGVFGTSDVWNEEIDRIGRFHTAFGTSVEEMETAAAAQIAFLFDVPFLGIRVVSNNITSGDAPFVPGTGDACQDYVMHVVRAYITTLRE